RTKNNTITNKKSKTRTAQPSSLAAFKTVSTTIPARSSISLIIGARNPLTTVPTALDINNRPFKILLRLCGILLYYISTKSLCQSTMSKSRTFFSLFLKYNYWTSKNWSCYDESVNCSKKNQPIEFNPFANFVRYKMTNLLFNTWNALLNHLPANGSA